MKLAKRFAALLMGATMAIGSVAGLAACGESGNTDNNTQSAGDEQIRAIYDLYASNCAENNVTPQTYEEWLASIKGADGQDGVTPHIGDDGYWWVGSQKTTVEAKGEKGDPGTNGVTPHIGKNGNWFIGEEDTHVPAQGAKGDEGDKGADGSSFLHGNGVPAETLGKEGDLYLDVSTWDVYERTETGWSEEPIGNIKGADGKDADGTTSSEISVDIQAGGTQEISVAGLTEGVHIIKADLGATKLSTGRIQVQVGDGVTSEVVFSQTRTDAAEGSNIYFGYLVVTANAETATVSAIGENVSATITFEDYVMPTIELGSSVEVPVNAVGTADENLLKVKMGSGFTGDGSYKFKIVSDDSAFPSQQIFFKIGASSINILRFNYDRSGTIKSTDYSSDGDTLAYLISAVATMDYAKVVFPVTLTVSAG